MSDTSLTAVHIKTLMDSGCTLDPGVISGMFQAERATALVEFDPTIRAEVKAAVEHWFANVSLDDLFLVHGWSLGSANHIEESGSDDDLDLS